MRSDSMWAISNKVYDSNLIWTQVQKMIFEFDSDSNPNSDSNLERSESILTIFKWSLRFEFDFNPNSKNEIWVWIRIRIRIRIRIWYEIGFHMNYFPMKYMIRIRLEPNSKNKIWIRLGFGFMIQSYNLPRNLDLTINPTSQIQIHWYKLFLKIPEVAFESYPANQCSFYFNLKLN